MRRSRSPFSTSNRGDISTHLDGSRMDEFRTRYRLSNLMFSPLYDRMGHVYTQTRRADERIAEIIWQGLGDARTVINVGAGAGSYEPPDCRVVAVEPSWRMIQQRFGAVPVVCGVAEA